ncbi:MAG: hypothetical protein Q7S13_03060 [Candidatus Omnitrophota bacterium]|nr:hypothetical protein [Candidatus Omnitrophota bacterium]
MMTLSFIRCFFVLISTAVGYFVGDLVLRPLTGAQIGCLSGLVLIFIENRLHRASVRGLSSMVFGLVLGIILAKLLADIMSLLPLGDVFLSISRVVLTLIFSYLGAVMALRGKDEFNIIIPYVQFRRQDMKEGIILLDTSAIIDGRVVNIYKSNFLDGRLVVPRFVLQELQKLADSSDDLKRQRGRRGMDLLHEMQADDTIDIRIHEDDFPGAESVDGKLIMLAKLMDASLCTTDYNLGRIAALQSIKVLNINDLLSSVRSTIVNGESLRIKLVKEGKEHDQAVGYLEDGTMIVVSNARKSIGEEVNVVVSSVLQTPSGKMIFAKLP